MEESMISRLGKRLWSIARMVYYMVLKGIISKQKLMVGLHLIMKRGKIAGKKAITTLLYRRRRHHHHPTFICTSNDCHVSSLAPREYEFSCSNSPAYPSSSFPFPFHFSKRKNHRYDEKSLSALKNSLEMLRTDISEESVVSPGPGFGPSPGPPVRQLRITDSDPFPVADADEDNRVDREAEEFIGRFYEQLRLQKRMAALEARFYEEMMINGSE